VVSTVVAGFTILNKPKQTLEKPEENRFTKVVLASKLEEPIQFEIMKDGRVLLQNVRAN
jgi:hypothetical protein